MYEYAEPVTAHGFVYMDTPGYDPVSATGQVAGGANMICFTTGRGSAYGCAPSPSLKLATNTALWRRQEDDMDINCGEIIDGTASVQEMGERIFELVLATASGEPTQERAPRLRAERVRALAGRRGDVGESAWANRPSKPPALRAQRGPHCCRPRAARADEAEQVAANLVLANLSGHDSHGVGMVPRYVDAVLEGGLQPNAARRRSMLDAGSLLALDGQRGYGQIVGVQAMRLAIARAAQHGSCILTLANAHHLGRIGHFAEMAAAEGLVSIHFVNVLSRPVVAPWGGGDGRFGTNPCCIGIPLAGARALRARLRHQPRRAGQDARRPQQGRARRAGRC